MKYLFLLLLTTAINAQQIAPKEAVVSKKAPVDTEKLAASDDDRNVLFETIAINKDFVRGSGKIVKSTKHVKDELVILWKTTIPGVKGRDEEINTEEKFVTYLIPLPAGHSTIIIKSGKFQNGIGKKVEEKPKEKKQPSWLSELRSEGTDHIIIICNFYNDHNNVVQPGGGHSFNESVWASAKAIKDQLENEGTVLIYSTGVDLEKEGVTHINDMAGLNAQLKRDNVSHIKKYYTLGHGEVVPWDTKVKRYQVRF